MKDKPNYVSSFSDETLLVPGKLFGMRQFSIRHNGQLTGISYTLPWEPGISTAMCGKQAELAARKALATPEHIAGVTCTCGFYAYFSNVEMSGTHTVDSSRVTAIVAGWGRVTVGRLGFRSQYGEIMALVLPDTEDTPSFKDFTFTERRAHKKLCKALVHVGQNAEPRWPRLVTECSLYSESRFFPPITEIKKIRAYYPLVPTFPTAEAALAQFPLSRSPEDRRE